MDDESIVGDECHIISGRSNGPRYDPAFPADRLDEPENLILLCRVHHKMVDDQDETYTVEVLQKLRANHERWVSSALAEEQGPSPVRLRRIKENIPTHLARLSSGRDLMRIVEHASASSFDHDEPQSEAEMELISAFLQEVQDWGELSSDLEAGDQVKRSYRMRVLLQELEGAGFWVFGAREIRRLEGGVGPPSAFPVAILKVVRCSSPEIIRMEFDGTAQVQDTKSKKATSPEIKGGDV